MFVEKLWNVHRDAFCGQGDHMSAEDAVLCRKMFFYGARTMFRVMLELDK